MKTIMILGGSASEVPVIERAVEMGHRVIVVDKSDDVPGFHVNTAIIERHSISDKNAILELAKKYQIDGILASVDAGVRTTAYVAKTLGLSGISEEAAVMGTDKVAMLLRLKEHNVPVPKFKVVENKREYKEALCEFTDRCIVKAPDTSGSRGVFLLKDLTSTKEIDYAYDYCMKFSGTGQLLIEEFMEGQEICAETLSSNGICYVIQITDQMHKQPPYFTDCGYSQPSMLSKATQNAIREIAINANMALENYQGSSCTEMIITKDGPKIVEIGVRLAGDFMTTGMVPLSTGIDMPGAVVKIALGEPINIAPLFNKGSCVRYFMKERIGTIKKIIGFEDAQKIPGVKAIGALKNVGEQATALRKSSDRLGYVMTQADTAEEAIKIAEKALEKIDFIVE